MSVRICVRHKVVVSSPCRRFDGLCPLCESEADEDSDGVPFQPAEDPLLTALVVVHESGRALVPKPVDDSDDGLVF